MMQVCSFEQVSVPPYKYLRVMTLFGCIYDLKCYSLSANIQDKTSCALNRMITVFMWSYHMWKKAYELSYVPMPQSISVLFCNFCLSINWSLDLNLPFISHLSNITCWNSWHSSYYFSINFLYFYSKNFWYIVRFFILLFLSEWMSCF